MRDREQRLQRALEELKHEDRTGDTDSFAQQWQQSSARIDARTQGKLAGRPTDGTPLLRWVSLAGGLAAAAALLLSLRSGEQRAPTAPTERDALATTQPADTTDPDPARAAQGPDMSSHVEEAWGSPIPSDSYLALGDLQMDTDDSMENEDESASNSLWRGHSDDLLELPLPDWPAEG